ncbi:MAG: hypothetical protein ACLTDC_10700 [Lachnospiraceae bacterium]
MNILVAYATILSWMIGGDDRKLYLLCSCTDSLSKTYRGIREKYPRRKHQRRSLIILKALSVCEKSCSDNVEEAACLTGKMLAKFYVGGCYGHQGR